MKNYFGFIDETGILQTDPKQRFFGLGLLRLEDTAEFYNLLSKYYHKIISGIEAKRKSKIKALPDPISKKIVFDLLSSNRRFEFKFNRIDEISLSDFMGLIDVYVQFPNNYFCTLVIDKDDPAFDFRAYFPAAWEAYIGYSKTLIKCNLQENENFAVIADYVDMPRRSTKYYERELNMIPGVYNTCRVESDASLYIQMIDVLLGCVVYDFKIQARMMKEDLENPKTKLLNYLKEKYNTPILARNQTFHKPNYFSVWLFKGQPK
jgi:hypothetical protein